MLSTQRTISYQTITYSKHISSERLFISAKPGNDIIIQKSTFWAPYCIIEYAS